MGRGWGEIVRRGGEEGGGGGNGSSGGHIFICIY